MAGRGQYLLALDVGDKRIGVARAHQVALLASPVTTLERSESTMRDIAGLVSSEDAGTVIVGLPRGMDGGYTDQTRATEAFAKELEKALPVPVVLSDETLTSVQAETELRGKKHQKGDIDALAAVYILESYIQENPGVARV